MDLEAFAKFILNALKAFMPDIIAQQIERLVGDAAREHNTFQIETTVTNAQLAIQNPTYGLSAAHTEREAILAALAGIPDPVNLPVSPPAGYGGASAQDVWDNAGIYTDDVYNQSYLYSPANLLSYLAADMFLRQECGGYQDVRNPDFLIIAGSTPRGGRSTMGWIGYAGADRVPPIVWSDWDGVDTLVAFLNSQQATYTFSATGPDGATTPGYAWARASVYDDTWYACKWSEKWLPILSGRAWSVDSLGILAAITALETSLEAYMDAVQTNIETAITTSQGVVTGAITTAVGDVNDHTDAQVAVTNGKVDNLDGDLAAARQDILDAIAGISAGSYLGPPTWPGVAGVTLGTPVALSANVQIDEPCDGCIVAVTSPPTGLSVRNIGGMPYDYRAGELAFITDDGDAETFQYLGFRAAIFTTKTMRRAAGIRARAVSNATGTITPWVITA